MRLALVLAMVVACFGGSIQGETISSPDGNVTATVTAGDIDGVKDCLLWRVAYKGRPLIVDSPLTFELKDMPALGIGCRITDAARSSHDETWRPVCGERNAIRDHYNQMELDVRDGQDRVLRLTVRAYDAGVALQSTFPKQANLQTFVIEAEHTQFRFTDNHVAWAVYSAQGVYSHVTLNDIKPNCERPLTIEIADGPASPSARPALVDFARMRLTPVAGVPCAIESMLAGEVNVETPYTTPWRVVMIADTSPGSWSRTTSSAISTTPAPLRTPPGSSPARSFAKSRSRPRAARPASISPSSDGLQYVEYDAGWYGHEYDDASDAPAVNARSEALPRRPLDLQEVIRYANEQEHRHHPLRQPRRLERQLDEILPLVSAVGCQGRQVRLRQRGQPAVDDAGCTRRSARPPTTSSWSTSTTSTAPPATAARIPTS